MARNDTTQRNPGGSDAFDLDALLHPARAFEHPLQVVRDADLTLNEKRAILASWASDVCAVDSDPTLRQMPGSGPVRFDDVMDALRLLDREAQAAGGASKGRRWVKLGDIRERLARRDRHQAGGTGGNSQQTFN